MADTEQRSPPPQSGPQFLLSNKLETAMWLSRLFTVYSFPKHISVSNLCMHIHDPK
uniref:Uncharacterized protein n=1 Tax=Sinocyclocheilus grahami TaxID=75366 RepID=A0A672TB80_SINGR